jgi:cytochrome c oxidase subunit II
MGNSLNFPLEPERASSLAGEHDAIFYLLTALTVFFTVLVMSLVILFAVRYRHGNKVDRSRPVFEHLPLEITWSVIPMILGLIVFYFGANLFIKQRTVPKNAMEINIIGKQWMWHVQHPNGVRENNTLHVPVNKDVRLTMISQDVIHAMYIPAFRMQFHVVPGRYTDSWFRATKPGVYQLFCGMYCGTQHSEMGGYVYVMPQKEYAEWLANGGNSAAPMTPAQSGAALFNKLACNNCHVGEDTDRAPTLNGIYGKTRPFIDGTSDVATEKYLREAILDPYSHINRGYGNTMPVYAGQITEEDVLNLISYIKSVGSTTPGPTAGISQGTPEAAKGLQNPAAPTAGEPANAGRGPSGNALFRPSPQSPGVGAIRPDTPRGP